MNFQPTQELSEIIKKIKKTKLNLDCFSTSYEKCIDERQKQMRSVIRSLRDDIGSDLSRHSKTYNFVMEIDVRDNYMVLVRKMSVLLKLCDSEVGIDDQINKCLANVNKTLRILMEIMGKNDDSDLVGMKVMFMFEEEIYNYRKQYIEAYEAYQQTPNFVVN